MLHITGAKSITGKTLEFSVPNPEDRIIDASHLLALPGLIDPHVHFRTPGLTEKEDWRTAALAAIHGGYTTVFDMPNTMPPTITADLLESKKHLINTQLREADIPLRYELYFGADKNHLSEIYKIKNQVIGIKVFMGCSTGNLVIDDDESLHAVFKIAATQNLIVAVHAEDEEILKLQKNKFKNSHKYSDHSHIRNIDAACRAVEKAIALSKIYHTKLYILHISSQAEIDLIKQAKSEGLSVYAETTPHHLFLSNADYAHLQGKAVVNPPLRNEKDRLAVLEAIQNGTIDTIGSDHAPHLEAEKALPYGQCPSGMPGIETTLPLLLTAYHEGLLSLEKILSLTCTRPREIFGLESNQDVVFVDLNKSKKVDNFQLKTKCHWSAFAGKILKGWPAYVILQNRFFDVR